MTSPGDIKGQSMIASLTVGELPYRLVESYPDLRTCGLIQLFFDPGRTAGAFTEIVELGLANIAASLY